MTSNEQLPKIKFITWFLFIYWQVFEKERKKVFVITSANVMHIVNCAKIGANVITGPLSAIEGLLKHPLTDIGLATFLADYQKGNG